MVVDGLGFRVFEEAEMSFLKRAGKRGFVSAVRSVMPSVTYPAHASIVTGVLPGSHGVVGNRFQDPEKGPVDLDRVDAGLLLEAPTVFELAEGGACIGIAVCRGASWVVSKKEVQSRPLWSWDEYAAAKAAEAIKELKPKLIAVNLPCVDGVGERYGVGSEVLKAAEKADELIQHLDAAARDCYRSHLLIALGDHGLTNVERRVDLSKLLSGVASVYPSHRAAHIYTSDTSEALRALREAEAAQAAYTREKLREAGLSHSRCGDIVVFAPPGVEYEQEGIRGSHGGLTPEEMWVPLVASRSEARCYSGSWVASAAKAALQYLMEARLEEAVASAYSRDPSHSLSHARRVAETATSLALDSGQSVQEARLAALLHDANRSQEPRGHEERAAKLAAELLREAGIPESTVKKVVEAILSHHKPPSEVKGLSALLWDADKLDALGLTGLCRCMIEAGAKGEDITQAIEHYLRDIRELAPGLHLSLSEKIAQQKLKAAQEALKALLRELSS